MTAAIRERLLSIGADPGDSADERFRKRLLVGVALLILPVAFAWGCVYWAFGERWVALTPWAYTAGSAISLAVFARTRNFAFLRTAQLLLERFDADGLTRRVGDERVLRRRAGTA